MSNTLNNMTINELLQVAEDHDIEVGEANNRAELIALIEMRGRHVLYFIEGGDD